MASWTVIAVAVLAGVGCWAPNGARSEELSLPAAPAEGWPTEAWQLSTPEQEGMDSGVLARLVESVGSFPYDSLLVVRHGKIVLDANYAPFEGGIRHDLRSVTKSVLGTLIGVAVQQGLLDSVDHPILDLFADKQVANVDDDKRAMTVKSLLDMTSGLQWQEKAYTPDESIIRMYGSPDRTAFVLNQPMSARPGSQFQYNGGNPYVLSALITKKTGLSAFDFAKQHLFGPLGITDVRWGHVDAQGISDGESGLFMTPRDMAKIGLLYLRNGVWDGTAILQPSWVQQVREGHVAATDGFHYANFWWSLLEKGAFMALGRHSQIILVLPKFDIVVVMTGVLRDDAYYPMPRLVDDVAGAVKSDGPLPADAIAQSLLATSIHAAESGQAFAVGLIPDLAGEVSGRTIRLADNPLKLKTVVLKLAEAQPSWEITTQEADRPIETYTGLLGLDGRFRKSPPAAYGIIAARGRWLNGDTFEMQRRVLGHGETQNWTFTFSGSSVDLVYSSTDGRREHIDGDLRE